MVLKAYRHPYQSHDDLLDREEYDAHLVVLRYVRDYRLMEIKFATNPNGLNRSRFTVPIPSSEFGELAKKMIEADPQAAIKAFGAAIHDAKITVRRDDSEEKTKAA